MEPHRLAEERSLAYHSAIAARLEQEPELLDRAAARVRAWSDGAPMSRSYVDAWRTALGGSLASLCALLVDPSEHGCAMRQTTPFAGALSPTERWRIFREVRARNA